MVSTAPYIEAGQTVNSNKPKIRSTRIFVDAHCFDTEFQGTQSFIRELYTELVNCPGLEVYFGAFYTRRLQNLFPSLPQSHFLAYRSPGSWRRLLIDIPAILAEYKFDFAHFQNIAPFRLHGTRSIVTLHDILYKEYNLGYSFWYRRVRDLAFGRSIRNATIRSTVSEYSRQGIASQYNMPASSVHVLPNAPCFKQGLFSAETAKTYLRDRYGIENFILNVSRVELRKNQELLMDAFIDLELYKKGLSLVFIGRDSKATKSYKEKLKKYASPSKIYWLEQVGQQELEAFYTAARLFVYPSAAEGFGIPPLEAACCLTPVLCSATTAMKDFDFFHPYRFDPGEKDVLYRLLIKMIDHPPTEEQLLHTRERIQERYNAKDTAERFAELIRVNSEL